MVGVLGLLRGFRPLPDEDVVHAEHDGGQGHGEHVSDHCKHTDHLLLVFRLVHFVLRFLAGELDASSHASGGALRSASSTHLSRRQYKQYSFSMIF